MTSLGKKGWIVLGSLIVAVAVGVVVWQAGYIPEIGKFFAAEPPGPPYPLPTLNGLLPDTGPAGTTVTLAMSAPLPPENEGRFTVVFGGTVAPIYRSPEGSFQFLVPPVRPGNYPVALRREASCNTPSPTRPPPRIVMDAGLETVTRPPPGCMWQEVQCIQAPCYPVLVCPSGTPAPSCMPLPSCVYEGEVRCAFDPMPGTVYCPLPTRTPTPTPIPPTCYGATIGNPVPFTVTEGQCMLRPACLDSRPSCDIAEPADGWCPPTPTPTATPLPPGISILKPTAGDQLRVPGVYNIIWAASGPLSPQDSPVEILLIKRGLGSGGIYRIGKSTLARGSFTWDTSLPVSRVTDGGPQNLANILGDDFFLIVQVSGQQESGGSGDFSLVGDSATPTPTQTPPVSPVEFWLEAPLGSAVPGGEITLPIMINTHGHSVTALKLELRLSGPGTIVELNRNSSDFPEVLEEPRVTQYSGSVTMGSGPDGGRSGDSLLVTAVRLRVDPGATGGSLVLTILGAPDSAVTAAGSSANVLGSVGTTASYPVKSGPTGRPGDLDGDGDVDIFDYNLVVSNFGRNY